MKTLLLILAASAAFAQTVAVGSLANTPDATAALNTWLITQTAATAPATGAVGLADTTVQLPTAIASACSESYAMVTLTSAGNVSTTNASTVSVPLGTQVTISNSLTPAYNATFATTSVPSANAGFTFALTIVDGTYSNASPSTNGYALVSYARCAVLIDSEVIGINGTTDGTNYTTIRGDLGTTAATHATGATITLLKYASLRSLYRANNQAVVSQILSTTATPRIAAQQAIITAAQAKIAQLQKAAGQ